MKRDDRGFGVVAVLFVVAVLAVVGWTGWQVTHRPPKVETKIDKNSKSASVFYYMSTATTSGGNELVTYRPSTGEKTSVKLPLTNERFLSTYSASANRTVQVRKQGTQVFYQSIIPKPGFTPGGEGEPQHDSDVFSVFDGKTETQLATIKNTDGRQVTDWVASPDGTMLYYLLQASDKGDFDLHRLRVKDKVDSIARVGVGQINNPLFVTADGTLLAYSGTGFDGITEHRVTKDGYSSRDLGKPCKCGFTYPQAVSPDGKKVLLESQSNGTKPANFGYYVLDTTTKKTTELGKEAVNVTRGGTVWSPDSDKVVYNAGSFGDPPASFVPRLEVRDLTGKKVVPILKDLQPKDSAVPVGWSEDGRYIAYTLHADKVNDLKFYDVATGKTLSSAIDLGTYASLMGPYGWY